VARRRRLLRDCTFQKSARSLRSDEARAVILFRRPGFGARRRRPPAPSEFYQAGLPVLGICYGEQRWRTSSAASRGRPPPRVRRAEVEVTEDWCVVRRRMAQGRAIPGVDEPWDRVTRLPDGFRPSPHRPMRRSPSSRTMSADSTPPVHLEVVHTPTAPLLRNFVRNIARLRPRLDYAGVPGRGD